MPGTLTDLFAWVVVATFVASALLGVRTDRARLTRGVAALAWLLFAAFWLSLVPHYVFTLKSYVEGTGAILAVPACAYAGYLVWTRRPSLLVLSRAVAIMGVVYLPFITIPALQRATVEMVTHHAELLMQTLGYSPAVAAGDKGYRSLFVFTNQSGHRFTTPVLVACSGIGSISIVSGLVLAVKAPLRRKLWGLALVIPLVYALNIVRVAFIVLAHGQQWFRSEAWLAELLFGVQNPLLASYYIADRLVAQVTSVVVLVLITLWLLGRLPGITAVLEEALYVLTRREFDIAGGLDRTEPSGPAESPRSRQGA